MSGEGGGEVCCDGEVDGGGNGCCGAVEKVE